MRVEGDPIPQNNGVFFLHSDHLGSTSLTTDASGNPVARQLYDAWGNVRSGGGMPTDIGYTGQRLDTSTGLMYYRARYYASSLGRFISADTIVPGAGNPQAFNRFAYGLNNPVKYNDPTGHCANSDPNKAWCENIVDYIHNLYGVFLKDGTAFWTSTTATIVQNVLKAIADHITAAAVYKNWEGVEMVMMAQTGSPTGSAWTPPDNNGNRIELPASGWDNESWVSNNIAEELGHSWDMRAKKPSALDAGLGSGWATMNTGGPLSNGLADYVGATTSACASSVACSYNPGPEDTVDGGKWQFYLLSLNPLCLFCEVGGHAASGPIEDWGGAFAQYIAPTPGRTLGPSRSAYVQQQLALLVNGQ
jgi:RHS repeat-associated protein